MRALKDRRIPQFSETVVRLPLFAAGSSLIVRVTSALSEFDAYRQASASFAVDPSCGAGLCG